jgi:hypothetical protein
MTRTNLYTVLCICVRLGAVYLFANAVIWVVDQVFATRQEVSSAAWLYAMGEPVLGIALAFLLWMFPGPLVRIAGDRRSLENFESDIAPDALQYIALSVLGLWFVITGLSQTAYTLHRWLFLSMYLNHQLPDPTADPKVYGLLLSELTKTALGIALALKARGMVAILARLRHGGLGAPMREADPARAEEK